MELLTAAAVGGPAQRAKKDHEPLPAGARCPNCDHLLTGRFCAECGQSTDLRHRSIGHLVWEGIESLLHIDGRLWRTVPALFVRPGTLGKDFLEGRIARHVPPFRMFLVALLLFIVSAEHGVDVSRRAGAAAQVRREAAFHDPAVRAKAADEARREAAADFASGRAEAERDRDEALKDPDERAGAEQQFQKDLAKLQAQRDQDLAQADSIAAGKFVPHHQPLFGSDEDRRAVADKLRAKAAKQPGGLAAEIRLRIAKAVENPEYYLMALFAWAHRLVMLLLPIVAGLLSLLYVTNKRFFVYDHLITAMNFLSFLFLAYAAGLWLPLDVQPWWLVLMLVWAPVNLFMTLRGAYGSSLIGATLKAAVVWVATLVSFAVLLVVLLGFVLFQL